MIAVFSHELRNPLAAISSMIDVLELGHGEIGMPDKKDLPPQFDKSALAFMRRNIQTLVHVVNELLGFTHLANDASGLEFEMVDAHEVIRFALKNLESQHKGTGIGIDLRLEAPRSYIRADALKLEQMGQRRFHPEQQAEVEAFNKLFAGKLPPITDRLPVTGNR